MITTRERLTVPEVVRGLVSARKTELDTLVGEFAPLKGRYFSYASQGKAAFEQIVVAAGLAGSRILVPAFFPDDFVGVFLKYAITPVFVDVDPRTYHLDLAAVTASQLDGASALLVEHTFGLPADGNRYRAYCDAHRLILIEDCARALGARSAGKLVGSFGHYAMFSLPKCVPVRAGGLAVAEAPFASFLQRSSVGVSGLLHALTLVKYPLTSAIERPIYAWLADSPIYPREVGNYDPRPAREFDRLGRFMLQAFLPHYSDAIAKKRRCATEVRTALSAMGFTFQSDGGGEHICTSLAAEPPAGYDADRLKSFLIRHGVKASAMWRNALGTSDFGRKTWRAAPETTPVALHLAKRLIQLPVSRFQTPDESRRIVDLCRRFASAPAEAGARGMPLAANES